MTLWVDPPLLVAAGAALERVAPDRRVRRGLEAVALAGFLGTGVPLYLNQRWIDWFRKPFGAESGRDFMLNSLLFGFEHRRPRPAVHLAAAVVFASYPFWLRLGARFARASPPRRPKRTRRTDFSKDFSKDSEVVGRES